MERNKALSTICCCSNKFINETLDHIYDQNERIRILGGRNIWQRHREAAREHQQLIEAILSGHKEEAVQILTAHLVKSKDAAIQSLLG
ncbi:MAG: FCD domain-containing protein [Lachnospiraceae bacterium]